MGFRRFLMVSVLGIAAFGLPEQALASLIDQTVTVTFHEPGFADLIDMVLVGDGREIEPLDLSNIGGGNTQDDGVLFDGEFIDIGDASIHYRVQGGGDGGTTGFGAGSFYEFSNLFWSGPVPGRITAVTVDLLNVTGVAFDSEVILTGNNSVKLLVDTLVVGPLTVGPDLGSITLNLTVDHTTPVPEPSTLLLSLLGLAGLVAARRRIK